MKKYLLFIIFSGCFSVVYAQNNQWAWMGGEKNYTNVEYGIKGVADSANHPGTRYGSAYWKDASGNFWIFGGTGSTENTSGSLNDLWKYDPATKWWTWVNGDSTAGQKAVYGARGIAAPANKPGATEHIGGTADRTVSWKDASGNFWMYSNVLWKYTPSTNQWTWINGDTAVTKAVYGIRGVADAANKPGKTNSVEWTDASGNFWLYGNVLWKYNVTTDLWTWVHGDTINTKTVYGLKGIPNNTNTPGTRKEVTGWSDTSGKFWLFGGSGTVSTPYYVRLSLYYLTGNLNDLWNYDPGTNLWTWVGGDTVQHAPNVTGTIGTAAPGNRPGARSAAVSWTDSSGNFWLFGGSEYIPYTASPSYSAYNDLWKYDRTGNLWTCFNNKLYISRDSFVVKGIESPYTKPSERYGGVGWTDTSGSLWMFGGTAEPTWPRMNDLLRYNPKTNLWALEQEAKYGGTPFGIYGLKGVANAINIPGGRLNAAGWTDSTGNFWLFGGFGSGNSQYQSLNDLWKKDTAGIWTWVSGLTTPVPSVRTYTTTWSDASGNFWLFGGRGEYTVYNNDMWKYDKNIDQWTQISGNTNSRYGIKGKPDTANKPGGRYNAVSWKDNAGRLWLFGGSSDYYHDYYPEYNDVWNYDTAIRQWTWVSGDSTAGQLGVYGKKGVPDVANKPRSRQGAVSWTDNANNVWIFGGSSNTLYYGSEHLNDLWKYNTVTNVWTWMSGDNTANKNGVYGTVGIPDAANKPGSRYDAVSWTDASGKFWLFGGTQYIVASEFLLNDLWNYDPATNLWTWVSGDSSINKYGIAGSRGTASAANKPGARSGSVAWKDKSGNLWLMGGRGYGVKNLAYLNDLWKFTLASPALPVKFISFTAVPQSNAVVLNWQTAEEQHCAYYSIQRSREGVGYDSIGTVMSSGNGYAINNYAFIDPHPFHDVNYYRIRQVDEDGRYTYSIVRKVMINSAGLSYALGQNPVTNELKINLESNQSLQLQLEVRDAAGHLLIHQNQPIARGSIMHVIPVKQLAAGVYFLTVNSGKTSITKKFIKQ